MRVSAAVLVPLLAVAPLAAQYRSVGGFGNVAFPATGHAPVSGNPWGNVAFPAVPGGAFALSGGNVGGNRYGSLVPGFRSHNGAGQGTHRNRSTGIYAYPVFVGGYGYGYAAPPEGTDQGQPAEGAP